MKRKEEIKLFYVISMAIGVLIGLVISMIITIIFKGIGCLAWKDKTA